MSKSLIEEAKKLTQKFKSEGAIIILQKQNDEGQKIAQFNLNHNQIRENCIILI